MKILVTFAVSTEFAAWRHQHDFREVTREPYPLYAAEIGDSSVRVLLTGIGTGAAALASRWALESPADLCISSGFAGGLAADLRVGDLLAARVVHRAEKELAVAGDRELLSAASDAGARRVERFLTSERVVSSIEEKAVLAESVDAVEMESFVILAEAARRGVRAVAVRAVSDTLEAPLPYDFDRACDSRGRIRMGALAMQILRNPRHLPGLLRLAKDCRLASERLAVFLNEYVDLLQVRLDVSHSEAFAAQ
jgi:nucleoside phosphorylase